MAEKNSKGENRWVPDWWHRYGAKMTLTNQTEKELIIKSKAALIIIRHISLVFSKDEISENNLNNSWVIDWEVTHCYPTREVVNGRRIFSENDMINAFDLTDKEPISESYNEWLINRYGADIAENGKFIRYGNHLNIPCPGTGNNGDPNISIELNQEIKEALLKIVSAR